ncbi:hypothetical protein Btru_070027 [Bulinus truncatus]|nr:hypothetical protein Btru_070027 [Bulinus truncatus]
MNVILFIINITLIQLIIVICLCIFSLILLMAQTMLMVSKTSSCKKNVKILTIDNDRYIEHIRISDALSEILAKDPICGRSDYSDLPGAKVTCSWRSFSEFPRRGSPSRLSSNRSHSQDLQKRNEARTRQRAKRQQLILQREERRLKQKAQQQLRRRQKETVTNFQESYKNTAIKSGLIISSSPEKHSPVKYKDDRDTYLYEKFKMNLAKKHSIPQSPRKKKVYEKRFKNTDIKKVNNCTSEIQDDEMDKNIHNMEKEKYMNEENYSLHNVTSSTQIRKDLKDADTGRMDVKINRTVPEVADADSSTPHVVARATRKRKIINYEEFPDEDIEEEDNTFSVDIKKYERKQCMKDKCSQKQIADVPQNFLLDASFKTGIEVEGEIVSDSSVKRPMTENNFQTLSSNNVQTTLSKNKKNFSVNTDTTSSKNSLIMSANSHLISNKMQTYSTNSQTIPFNNKQRAQLNNQCDNSFIVNLNESSLTSRMIHNPISIHSMTSSQEGQSSLSSVMTSRPKGFSILTSHCDTLSCSTNTDSCKLHYTNLKSSTSSHQHVSSSNNVSMPNSWYISPLNHSSLCPSTYRHYSPFGEPINSLPQDRSLSSSTITARPLNETDHFRYKTVPCETDSSYINSRKTVNGNRSDTIIPKPRLLDSQGFPLIHSPKEFINTSLHCSHPSCLSDYSSVNNLVLCENGCHPNNQLLFNSDGWPGHVQKHCIGAKYMDLSDCHQPLTVKTTTNVSQSLSKHPESYVQFPRYPLYNKPSMERSQNSMHRAIVVSSGHSRPEARLVSEKSTGVSGCIAKENVSKPRISYDKQPNSSFYQSSNSIFQKHNSSNDIWRKYTDSTKDTTLSNNAKAVSEDTAKLDRTLPHTAKFVAITSAAKSTQEDTNIQTRINPGDMTKGNFSVYGKTLEKVTLREQTILEHYDVPSDNHNMNSTTIHNNRHVKQESKLIDQDRTVSIDHSVIVNGLHSSQDNGYFSSILNTSKLSLQSSSILNLTVPEKPSSNFTKSATEIKKEIYTQSVSVSSIPHAPSTYQPFLDKSKISHQPTTSKDDLYSDVRLPSGLQSKDTRFQAGHHSQDAVTLPVDLRLQMKLASCTEKNAPSNVKFSSVISSDLNDGITLSNGNTSTDILSPTNRFSTLAEVVENSTSEERVIVRNHKSPVNYATDLTHPTSTQIEKFHTNLEEKQCEISLVQSKTQEIANVSKSKSSFCVPQVAVIITAPVIPQKVMASEKHAPLSAWHISNCNFNCDDVPQHNVINNCTTEDPNMYTITVSLPSVNKESVQVEPDLSLIKSEDGGLPVSLHLKEVIDLSLDTEDLFLQDRNSATMLPYLSNVNVTPEFNNTLQKVSDNIKFVSDNLNGKQTARDNCNKVTSNTSTSSHQITSDSFNTSPSYQIQLSSDATDNSSKKNIETNMPTSQLACSTRFQQVISKIASWTTDEVHIWLKSHHMDKICPNNNGFPCSLLTAKPELLF